MTAHPQAGSLKRESDSIGKSRGIGHQRRRGDDALAMALQDGSVDPTGEAEVVRIDDEAKHATG